MTQCNDNNTPDTGDDDTFTFVLNTAGGSGSTYSISGGITASNVAYGTSYRSVALPISGGPVTITLTDDQTGCTKTVIITPPANCSSCPPKICVPITTIVRRSSI